MRRGTRAGSRTRLLEVDVHVPGDPPYHDPRQRRMLLRAPVQRTVHVGQLGHVHDLVAGRHGPSRIARHSFKHDQAACPQVRAELVHSAKHLGRIMHDHRVHGLREHRQRPSYLRVAVGEDIRWRERLLRCLERVRRDRPEPGVVGVGADLKHPRPALRDR